MKEYAFLSICNFFQVHTPVFSHAKTSFFKCPANAAKNLVAAIAGLERMGVCTCHLKAISGLKKLLLYLQ